MSNNGQNKLDLKAYTESRREQERLDPATHESIRLNSFRTQRQKEKMDALKGAEILSDFYNGMNVGKETERDGEKGKYVEINIPGDEKSEQLQCFVSPSSEFGIPCVHIGEDNLNKIKSYFGKYNIPISNYMICHAIAVRSGYIKAEDVRLEDKSKEHKLRSRPVDNDPFKFDKNDPDPNYASLLMAE